MRFTEEHCKTIGRHVLDSVIRWQENPRGNSVIIPIRIPNDPDGWNMSIECKAPWKIENYFEDGEMKTKHWTLAEYMEKVGTK